MWNASLIRNSKVTIPRMDIIVEMAKAMKSCQIYRACHLSGNLYGCAEEPYALHVLPLPEEAIPPISFSFRLDTINVPLVQEYISFDYFANCDWAMLPSAIENDGRFVQHYDMKTDRWIIYDTVAGKRKIDAVDWYIDLYAPDTAKSIPMHRLEELIYNKGVLEPSLSNRYVFTGVENYPQVIEVTTNRVSIGRKVLSLEGNDKRYNMMVFKNLLNLNKNDTLDVVVRDRLDNPAIYEAEFIIRRKKSAIPHIMHKYQESIYTQFYHI